MTKQKIIDNLRSLADELDAIKETTEDKDFVLVVRPGLRPIRQALRAMARS